MELGDTVKQLDRKPAIDHTHSNVVIFKITKPWFWETQNSTPVNVEGKWVWQTLLLSIPNFNTWKKDIFYCRETGPWKRTWRCTCAEVCLCPALARALLVCICPGLYLGSLTEIARNDCYPWYYFRFPYKRMKNETYVSWGNSCTDWRECWKWTMLPYQVTL